MIFLSMLYYEQSFDFVDNNFTTIPVVMLNDLLDLTVLSGHSKISDLSKQIENRYNIVFIFSSWLFSSKRKYFFFETQLEDSVQLYVTVNSQVTVICVTITNSLKFGKKSELRIRLAGLTNLEQQCSNSLHCAEFYLRI